MKEIKIIENFRDSVENICNNFSISNISISDIEKCYNERHRHYHNISHINDLLVKIDELFMYNDNDISEDMFINLITVALFHDIVYEPWNIVPGDNERKSAEFFKQHFDVNELPEIYDAIIDTYERKNDTELKRIFNKLDLSILHSSMSELIEYEHKIFKEYQFVDVDEYIKNRVSFLNSLNFDDVDVERNIENLIDYIINRKYNIAIYPGSFNDFHIGHYNILTKAEELFDKVIVVKAVNSSKSNSIENLYEQYDKLKKQLPDREVKFVEGNIIEKLFVDNKRNPVLIRGLRNGYDLVYEENYLTFCKDYHSELRYALILCDKEYSHISSSTLRTLSVDDDVRKKYTQTIYKN
jgi:pantetheine-phosphate adenylyltransferase